MVSVQEKFMDIALEKVDKSLMMDTIRDLVTGDNARVGGCQGEKNAAKYIKNRFDAIHLESSIHQFDLNRPVSLGVGFLKVNGESLAIKSFNGGKAISNDFNYDLVFAGLGTDDEIKELGSLEGKAVLVERGKNTFAEKAANVYNAGAKAIIMFNTEESIATGSLGKEIPKVPVLGMPKSAGDKLVSMLKENTITLTSENFDIDIEYHDTSDSLNVIGTLYAQNATEDTKTIILGAHYDSASSPGASDNATGVCVMLEVARILSSDEIKGNLKYNMQFMGFGSEELGLLGSTAYANKLKDENKIDTIKAMINLDMVGVGDCINVFNASNDLSKHISDIAVKHIKAGAGVYGGQYTGMTNSDHGPFEAIGIPSSLVQTGPDHHFHTENDTVDKVDDNNLYNVTKVIVGIMLELQNS